MNQQARQPSDAEQTKLEQTIDKLTQLPHKERPLRAQVEDLRPAILEALEKGYSYSEVVALLAEQGIHITASTLKQYVHSRKPSELTSVVEEPESVETSAMAKPESVETPATEPAHSQKRPPLGMPKQL